MFQYYGSCPSCNAVLQVPMIAAVNGHCITGGMEMALQCDLIVASTSAVFRCTAPPHPSHPHRTSFSTLLHGVDSFLIPAIQS